MYTKVLAKTKLILYKNMCGRRTRTPTHTSIRIIDSKTLLIYETTGGFWRTR